MAAISAVLCVVIVASQTKAIGIKRLNGIGAVRIWWQTSGAVQLIVLGLSVATCVAVQFLFPGTTSRTLLSMLSASVKTIVIPSIVAVAIQVYLIKHTALSSLLKGMSI
jgi:hypothetical protein